MTSRLGASAAGSRVHASPRAGRAGQTLTLMDADLQHSIKHRARLLPLATPQHHIIDLYCQRTKVAEDAVRNPHIGFRNPLTTTRSVDKASETHTSSQAKGIRGTPSKTPTTDTTTPSCTGTRLSDLPKSYSKDPISQRPWALPQISNLRPRNLLRLHPLRQRPRHQHLNRQEQPARPHNHHSPLHPRLCRNSRLAMPG